MLDGGEAFEDLDLDAELFVQFAVKRLGFGLAGFGLAAGKLPFALEVASFRPSGDQEAAAAFDDGADDVADVELGLA